MLAAPAIVNDLTAFIGLFLAICAALAALWKVAKPGVAQLLRAIVQEELAPIIADQLAIRHELIAHLRHEEREIGEMKTDLAVVRHDVGVGGRLDARFGEIEHELAKHVEDHRAHMR